MSDFTSAKVVDVATDTTTVVAGPCRLYGVYVNTVLSAHTLPIQDRELTSPENTPATIVTIPASAAAGSMYNFPGIQFNSALVINPNDAATGNITVIFKSGTAGSLGLPQI